MTIGVPIDDLMPRTYQKLPPGKYIGRLQSLEKRTNNAGWEAVGGSIGDITAVDGSDEVSTRNGEMVSTRGQTRTFALTTLSSPKAMEIGKQQLTGLAWALGAAEISENSEGKQVATFTAASADEAIELLSGNVGDTVGFSITHKARSRKNESGERVTVLDDDGDPIMDDEIARFYPVSVVKA